MSSKNSSQSGVKTLRIKTPVKQYTSQQSQQMVQDNPTYYITSPNHQPHEHFQYRSTNDAPFVRKTTDSTKVRDVFMNITTKFEAQRGRENLKYPKEILWIVGPPASGKSTIGKYLKRERKYVHKSMSMRDLCRSVIQGNNGKLDINKVIEQLLDFLFIIGSDPINKGVCIDDFVSITCSRLLPFMFAYFQNLHQEFPDRSPPVFKFCVIFATQKTSLERQKIKQGAEFNSAACARLYHKFCTRTKTVVDLLKMYFKFNIIDSNGTENVTKLIAQTEIKNDKNGTMHKGANLKDALSNNPTVSPRNPIPYMNYRNSSRVNSSTGYNSRPDNQQYPNKSSSIMSSYGYSQSFYPKSRKLSPDVEAFYPAKNLNSPSSNISNPNNNNGGGGSYNMGLSVSSNRRIQSSSAIVRTPTQKNILAKSPLNDYCTKIKDTHMQQKLRTSVSKILSQTFHKSLKGAYLDKLNESILLDKVINNLDDYLLQLSVKGIDCMMYWTNNGNNVYFMDYNFNFVELDHNQYRGLNFEKDVLLDGKLICDIETQEVIYFINDIAMNGTGKSVRGSFADVRTSEAKIILSTIQQYATDGPITIVLNEYRTINVRNVNEALGDTSYMLASNDSNVSTDMYEKYISGLQFAPNKCKFHYSKLNPSYVWKEKKSNIGRGMLKYTLISKLKN